MIDLPEKDLALVRKILDVFAEGQEVVAYGSRVRGTSHKFSDLDLCIMNDEKALPHSTQELKDIFRASYLPVSVDVVAWGGLSDDFRRIIAEKNEVVQERHN